jgi:hypothetical protein
MRAGRFFPPADGYRMPNAAAARLRYVSKAESSGDQEDEVSSNLDGESALSRGNIPRGMLWSNLD